MNVEVTGRDAFCLLVKAIRRSCSLSFLYFKWFLLKTVSIIGYHFAEDRERFEYWLIQIGNRLFRRMYPDELFADFDSYVDLINEDLAVYNRLVSPKKWLSGKTVLDLGSGLGQYSSLLKQGGARFVIGVEYQAEKAVFARHRFCNISNLCFINGDALSLPLASGSVDSIFSHTVFEHLPKLPEILQELRRVLSTNGKVVLSFNFFHSPWGHHLFPYVHFPWATWVVSERVLCDFWSRALALEQCQGRAMFFTQGCRIANLSEGDEIHLNKATFDEFEQMAQNAAFRITARFCSNPIARVFPVILNLPKLRYFLAETIFYVLEPVGNP